MKVPAIERNNEKLQAYAKKFSRAKHLKSKKVSYGAFLQDKLLVTHAVKQGVTMALFEEIKANSLFNDQQWADFLTINVRTLQRYKKEKQHVFKPMQSEKIFELAEVLDTGYKVFDSGEDFNIWLNSPSVALGNEKPMNLLDTSYGKDLVLAELNRIEYGIFV